jgi:hypothetical protein
MPDDAMIDSSIDAPPACAAPNTFGPEMTFPIGAPGLALAVGTLDAGPTVDVAIVTPNEVVILHGDGTGTSFANPTQVATQAIGVAIEDFDVDARNDLVLWNSDGVVLRRQNAASPGTFLAEQPLPGPFQNVTNVLVEIFDPNPDLLVEDDLSGIRLFTSRLGNPGTFGREGAIGGAGDTLILAGNIDGQGGKDILLVEAGTVKLSRGSGGTNLGAPTVVATGATGRAVGIGRFDGDNRIDIAIATSAGGKIFSQSTAVPGTFNELAGTIPGVVGDSLLVADINRDGTDDLVVQGSIVLQCPGDPGVFTQVESVTSLPPAVLADVNGDGKLDLLRLVGENLVVRLQ